MSQVDSVISARMRGGERLRRAAPGALWGGMVLSLFLHGSLIGILVWRLGLSNSPSGAVETGQDEFHAVGLIQKPHRREPQEPKKNQQSRPDATANFSRFANGGVLQGPQHEVAKQPPLNLTLPNSGRNILGPGRSIPAIPPGMASGKVRPSRISARSTAEPKPLGGGRTSFFKITDKGKRIVYVVDRSGSMYGHPLQMAKLQLKRSLNQLSVEQRFLVIFYSEVPRLMNVSRIPNERLSLATLSNIEKVKQKIDAVSAKGGTEHMRALQAALSLRPDVVYFLTDADSLLDAADLNTIRIFNRSRAHIHCIQFGKGPNLIKNNFLTRLAEMTGGKHRYHNVNDFK